MNERIADSPASIYARGLAAGTLLYQRCSDCHSAVFHPRVVCPRCGGAALEWCQSTGRGTVYSSTVVRSRSGANPVALIDLDEGFRMMCRLRSEADAVIGARVAAVIPEGCTIDELLFAMEEDR